jgi:hypothetical protein
MKFSRTKPKQRTSVDELPAHGTFIPVPRFQTHIPIRHARRYRNKSLIFQRDNCREITEELAWRDDASFIESSF